MWTGASRWAATRSSAPTRTCWGAPPSARRSRGGPSSFLRDAFVGDRARVISSHWQRSCVISSGCNVGPFRLHSAPTPCSPRAPGRHVSVEMKNSRIGEPARYRTSADVGDAIVGVDGNIAAGNIIANYDGSTRHATQIGDRVRTGSDTTIVAPVSIGDDAFDGRGVGDHARRAAGAAWRSRVSSRRMSTATPRRRAARRLREQQHEWSSWRIGERGAECARHATHGARALIGRAPRSFGTIVDRSAANTEEGRTVADSTCCVITPRKRLMIFSGQRQPLPCGEDADELDVHLGSVRAARPSPTARSMRRYEETFAASTCSSSSRRRTT